MIIKVFLVVGVLGFVAMVYRGAGGPGQLAVRRLIAILLAVLGVLAVLVPDTVTWLANRVGVVRGTDLVLYVLVVAFLWVTVGVHRRMSDLERRYVELARRQAINEALNTATQSEMVSSLNETDGESPRQVAQ